MCKYIFVLGGVFSGTGKGIASASLAFLMKQRGHSINLIKLDPYLNTSASVLSPKEHGEVYLCDDGSECDLDLGHYARIANIEVNKDNIFTSGYFYKTLIQEEENGIYLGKTLQIFPHLTDKIQEKIVECGKDVDLLFVEIGGTSGDVEGSPYLEAIRQFKLKHPYDVLTILVSPIIWNNVVQEFKTKPLQNSVRTLQSCGIQPDILLCRTDREVPENILDKVAHSTNVSRECVFDAPDVKSIYNVPIEFYDRHLDDLIVDKFHFKRNGCRIHKFRDLVEKYQKENLLEVNIGIFGKYENCNEAYLSLKESLFHAAVANNVKVNIVWSNAEDLEKKKDIAEYFKNIHGIIVPGGFDKRGVEGKIKAIKYARENKVPFLGICLGLQCAVIEFARNVCGIKNATSMEFEPDTPSPVVHFIEGQQDINKKSNTLRLGSYDCKLKKDSLAYSFYESKIISERHRHRLEVNEEYVSKLEEKGFIVSGRNPETNLVEIMELSREVHPYFIATQAHPEFKSRLLKPAPLFSGLVKETINFYEKHNK